MAKQKTAITPTQKTAIKTIKLQSHEKISVQKHHDEKIALSLLMTGTALVIYYFW